MNQQRKGIIERKTDCTGKLVSRLSKSITNE